MKRSEQRRDHKPEPISMVSPQPCQVCGDRIQQVYDRHLPVKSRTYWRHWRRPKKDV